MRIVELRVDAFGRLANFSANFGDGLTVIAGPNESGKSTLAECVIRLLYGYPERRFNAARERYLPWHSSRSYRATLRYRLDDGREFETTRTFSDEDVPTTTVELPTGREVVELKGNRLSSPGETFLGLSYDMYKSAAVIRAAEFSNGSFGDVAGEIADRLADIVGAAGDASAADAMGRLQDFVQKIGGGPRATTTSLTQAIAQARQADESLRVYQAQFEGFRETLQRRSDLQEEIASLERRSEALRTALSTVRLVAVRAQIAAVDDARRRYRAELEARDRIAVAHPRLPALTDEINDVTAALSVAEAAQLEAEKRTADSAAARQSLHKELNACAADVKSAEARRRELERAIEKARPAPPAPISADSLQELEQISQQVDEYEANWRKADTIAAFARQAAAPSMLGAVLVGALSLVAIAAALVAHLIDLLWAGGGGALAALLLFIQWSIALKTRAATIRARQDQAADAKDLWKHAEHNLQARCAAIGCQDVAEVQSALRRHLEAEKLRADHTAAQQSELLQGRQRDVLQSRLADLARYESELDAARQRAQEYRDNLTRLLDELEIPSGSLEARVEAFRQGRSNSATATRLDAKIAGARADLERALAGATEEALQAEQARLVAACASNAVVDPGLAARGAQSLRDELESVTHQLEEKLRALERVHGQLQTFEQDHPTGAAPLEERLAACLERQGALEFSKRAAELALETIANVKDAVHRDFVPVLNEAVSLAAARITKGRYAQAFVDPSDLTVRVRLPETGQPFDATQLSTGTREQFHLALRATLASKLGSGEHVPLILDDALAHSDDDRLGAALAHLAGAAKTGEQILFFTQRAGVVEAATKMDGVSVVWIDGPAA